MKKINRKNIILFCSLAIIIVGAIYSLSVIYAKYYASRNNKGIGVASNLYFNSDKLRKSTGITDIDAILDDNSTINKINVFSNSGSWSTGGTLLLTFDVRNYDNSILYNENNLNITYNVVFVMLDEPKGAEYSIVAPDNTTYSLENKGDKVELDEVVEGGSLKADTFGVKITAIPGQEYGVSRVLVMAYPTSPYYIFREKTEEQEYRLLGIFEGHQTDMEMSIEESGFLVQQEDGYSSSTWKTKVKNLSGYIYNFKTAGDVVMDADASSKQKAILTWNHNYLTIDEYDENYLYAQEQQAAGKEFITEDGDYTSMVIMVLPYTSIDTTFYKTADFEAEYKSKGLNDAGRLWFEELVTVRVAD